MLLHLQKLFPPKAFISKLLMTFDTVAIKSSRSKKCCYIWLLPINIANTY